MYASRKLKILSGNTDHIKTEDDHRKDVLKVGDLIYVHASTGGTRTYSLHPVVSNTGTVVDIGDGTAISATDSD